MKSLSRRIILITMLALLALPALQSTAPATALAQTGDDAELLAEFIGQVENTTPEAGPESGTLVMDGGPDNTSSLGVELTDQVIHVEVLAPQVDTGEIWAVAIAFRSSGDQFHYFLYWSDGGWSFSPAGGGKVESGEAVLPGEAGTPVTIDIAAAGPSGYVGINGEYTATLDLSSQLGAGDVAISANLIGSFDPDDEPVSFSDFTVWPLAAEVPPVEASPQPEASPTAEASPAIQPEPVTSPQAEPAASPPTEASPVDGAASPQPEPAPVEGTASPQTEPVIQIDPSLDDEAQFNTLLQAATSQPIIFGPVNDTLPHNPDSVSFYPTDVSVTNFAVRVECIGTVAAAEGFWDCGIAFRDTDTADHYRVAYISDGYWFLSIGAGEPLMTGTDAPPSPSVGDKVTLNLIVIGADGYFGVNDQFIAKFDLSAIPGPGSIDLTSAFFNDTFIPDGGLQFEDFVVWSLDSATGLQAATPTQQAGDEPTPTEAAPSLTPTVPPAESPVVGGNVVGNTYTSPTYGYSLTWDDTWTVDSDESDETGDYFGLNNGVVIADLIGEPWDPAEGNCFERLELFYSSNPAYSDIQSATDTASAIPDLWEITGILTMTFTDEETGEATDYINYAACSQIPGQDAIVSLEQFVPVSDFRAQVEAMDALRAGFVPSGGAVVPDQTPTPGVEGSPTVVGEESPTAIAGQTSNVVGTTYTSPIFGYSFSWDETYEVLLDQSENGVDYLRISNDTITVDLFAAAGDNTPEQCIDDLVLFYENDPLYSDVQFVTDAQDQPIRASGDGFATALISFTTTNDEGAEVTQYDNVICHRLEERNAVVVLEVFTSPADSILQSAAVTELQGNLVLPGGVAVAPTVEVALTPQIEPTVEDPVATVEPPPIEEITTATFLLSPIEESGVQGTGTFEGQARLVTMTAIVIGAAPGDLVTVHRGSCDTLEAGGEPDYIVGELDESGLLREDVQVRLALLAGSEPYSVVIYGGDDDFSMPLACGQIERR